MKNVKIRKIKLAEIGSALETGICVGAMFIDPEVAIERIASLHSSTKDSDGMELAKLIEEGKIYSAFTQGELRPSMPEEFDGIQESDMYFVHWDKKKKK